MSKSPLVAGWSDEPEPSEQAYRIPLLRCRVGQTLSVVFLQPMAVGTYLHWNGFRTVQCTGETCQHCACNTRRDWKMYIPVWSPASGSMAMLELPYSALKYFQKQYMAAMTCYGFHAEIARVGDNPKGKVAVVFRQKYKGTTPLPEAPEAIGYMSKVWGVCHSDPTPKRETRPKSGLRKEEPTDNGRVSRDE